MNEEKRFTIRLANGKEATFDSGEALGSWAGGERAPAGAKRKPPRKRSRHGRSRKAMRNAKEVAAAPLASFNTTRYANRHSGEA